MSSNLRQELASRFDRFTEIRFPKLGYRVEGLPETDSALAGLVTQALRHGSRKIVDEAPIISDELLKEVNRVCELSKGSSDAVELESYVSQMIELEDQLRRTHAVDM